MTSKRTPPHRQEPRSAFSELVPPAMSAQVSPAVARQARTTGAEDADLGPVFRNDP